jgi:hypothetical protein
MRLPDNWGATDAEVADTYPCDEVLPGPTESWWRAVPTKADPAAQYRWLCQLTVAPYSYDLLDNHGRRSPRTRTPGLEELTVGQRMTRIFTLAHFTPGRDLTIRIADRRVFGDVAITYRANPGRLVAKLAVDAGSCAVRRRLLCWGDLVMMRRQLLTLADLAGRERV